MNMASVSPLVLIGLGLIGLGILGGVRVLIRRLGSRIIAAVAVLVIVFGLGILGETNQRVFPKIVVADPDHEIIGGEPVGDLGSVHVDVAQLQTRPGDLSAWDPLPGIGLTFCVVFGFVVITAPAAAAAPVADTACASDGRLSVSMHGG